MYASLAAIGVLARLRSVLLREAVASKRSCRSVGLFVGRLVMLFLLPLVLVVVLILLLTLPTAAQTSELVQAVITRKIPTMLHSLA